MIISDIFTTLMVVGGASLNDEAYSDVELIDLSDEMKVCKKPPKYPGANFGSVGAYVNQKAIICGGFPFTADCYAYEPSQNDWIKTTIMTTSRKSAYSAIIHGKWWITGGYNGVEDLLSSTEIYEADMNIFKRYLDLPMPMEYHNILAVNSSTVIILGGHEATDKFHIYNFDDESWTIGPPALSKRKWFQVGLITFANGTSVIMNAGGENGIIAKTTEIFNLDEMTWNKGPNLPIRISLGTTVQWRNSFIIIGGFNYGQYLDTLFYYNVEANNWQEMNQKLTTAREQTAAFIVPNYFC